MNEIKTKVFWAGPTQAVAIPNAFALTTSEVTIHREGDRLIIEAPEANAGKAKSWSEFFDNLDPVDVEWPDLDQGLLPADDINL